VPLGQQQVVAPGIVQTIGGDPQHAIIEVDQQIGARERGADEAAALARHPHDVLAHPQRLGPQRGKAIVSDGHGQRGRQLGRHQVASAR
jgi:hypothetical protein